jgi:hypothetical protein
MPKTVGKPDSSINLIVNRLRRVYQWSPHMKPSCMLACLCLSGAISLVAQSTEPGTPLPETPDPRGWIRLFDGKTLSGWTTHDPGSWSIDAEGCLVGKGRRSHLFSPLTYTNLEFKAEIKLNARGNSGMYFRAVNMPGWPRGYEAQVENTSPDPQKTGSLYNFARVTEQLIPDDTWWTQHVIAVGNRIIIKVNDKIVVDFVDEKKTYTAGHLALQQHDPLSVVHYRNLAVRRLPSDEEAAWKIVRRDSPEIPEKSEKKP